MPHKEQKMPPARPNLQIKTSQPPPTAPQPGVAGKPPNVHAHDVLGSSTMIAHNLQSGTYTTTQQPSTTTPQPSITTPNPSAPSSDPPAPPHSPISPSNIATSLAAMPPFSAPTVIPRPSPAPIPLAAADNMDVIALRSAASLLQLQAATARRDVQALVRMREQALLDPEAFVRAAVARERGGREEAGRNGGREDLLAPTLGYLVQGLGEGAEILQPEADADAEMRDAPAAGSPNLKAKPETDKPTGNDDNDDDDAADAAASDSDDSSATPPRFPTPPRAQNIYRMPPINWAKYHVVGSGLERLHAEQTARPSGGTPHVDGQGGSRALQDAYVLAAPYSPVTDAARVMGTSSEHPMQTRRGLRKQ